MKRVWSHGLSEPTGLAREWNIDLSGLELQPASIIIQGIRGLVKPNGHTKKSLAEIQDALGADLGTADNPLLVTGKPMPGGETVAILQHISAALQFFQLLH